MGPDFTWKAFFRGMDTGGNGQFDLDGLTEMIVKLYHNQEGDVEAGKQSEANGAEVLKMYSTIYGNTNFITPLLSIGCFLKTGSILKPEFPHTIR